MKKLTRSIFALLLVALLVVGMMPFGAFATDADTEPAEVPEEPTEAETLTEAVDEPSEPEPLLSEEPTEHDMSEPVEVPELEIPAELHETRSYSAGDNVTVYNYYHAFFIISEMGCIDGSPLLTSRSSWPGNDAYDWGSCGGKYNLFYCIDFYAHGSANKPTTKPGTPLEKTPAWTAISPEGQKGIQLALIYGVPNCDAYYDNAYGYQATQIIIWEYQLGVRTDATQKPTFFNTTLNRYPKIKDAYDAILLNISNHQTRPSFHGTTVNLSAIGKENAVTLTDTTGFFKNDSWSAVGSHDGVELEQSGGTLKVWATKYGGSVDVTLERNLRVATGNALCAFTGNQSCVTGVADDPLEAKFTVKLPSMGNLKIIKTAPDGMNKSNIRFDIYEGYTDLTNGKIFATIYTNADGVTTASGLSAGKNYYVREVVPENSAKKPEWTITGASASGISADVAWFTAVAGSTVQINCKNDWDYSDAMLTKVTDDGKNTANRVFYLYDGWDNYTVDKRFAELTTDGNGKATVAKLIPGHWYYLIERGFLPNEDGMPEWEITGVEEWKVSNGAGTKVAMFRPKGGDSIKIVCKNHSRTLGQIEVDKTDEGGKLRAGATFMLEWQDGSVWKPVIPATADTIGKVGTCSSEGLTSKGELTTGKSGKVIYTDLCVQDEKGNPIRYRLTETKAPSGMALLANPVYEGIITETNNEYHLYLKAVDDSNFVLPFTGDHGFMTATFGILCMGAALCAVFFAARKKIHNI